MQFLVIFYVLFNIKLDKKTNLVDFGLSLFKYLNLCTLLEIATQRHH